MHDQIQAARNLNPQILAISRALQNGLDAAAHYAAQAPDATLQSLVLDSAAQRFHADYGESLDFWRLVLSDVALHAQVATLPAAQVAPEAPPAPLFVPALATPTSVTATAVATKRKKTASEMTAEYRAKRQANFDPEDPKEFMLLRRTVVAQGRRYLQSTGESVSEMRKRCLLLGVDVNLNGFYQLLSEKGLEKTTHFGEKRLQDIVAALTLLNEGLPNPASTPAYTSNYPTGVVPNVQPPVEPQIVPRTKDDVVAPAKPEYVKPGDRVKVVTAIFQERGKNVVVTQGEIAKRLDVSLGAVQEVVKNVRGVKHIGGGRFVLR